MSSSPAAPEPYVVEDCRGVMQLMSDGTVRRSTEPAFTVEIPDDADCGVEWKDVTWEPEHGLNARLYRPRHLGAANDARMPVVAYFHGGGFCIGSGRWPSFHACCLRLAAELPAAVLSFDYRLAPEHRLPAAQEDGGKAMSWLHSHAAHDPWLADAADFACVFVAGDSAGGNIAHHVAAAFGKTGLGPFIRLSGHVLLWPAMAGEARTRAELECPPGAFLTTETCDKYCRLALPEGATRDHPAINPAGPQAPGLEAVEMAPMLVVAGERDVLRERNAEYARRMKEEWGKDVEYVMLAGVEHGFFNRAPWSERADELVRLVRRFVVEHIVSKTRQTEGRRSTKHISTPRFLRGKPSKAKEKTTGTSQGTFSLYLKRLQERRTTAAAYKRNNDDNGGDPNLVQYVPYPPPHPPSAHP